MTGPLGVPLVVTEPGDELAAALRYIDHTVDAAGWGQPNRLFMFRREGRSPMVSVCEGPPFEVDPVSFFRGFMLRLWGRPADAVRLLQHNRGINGMAVTFETWAVEEPSDAAGRAQLDQDRKALRLHLRADRIESRLAVAVMLDGRTATLQHHRGRAAEPVKPRDEEVTSMLAGFLGTLAMLAPGYVGG